MIEALGSRFVLLRLDLFRSPREIVRPLNVIWTPTLLFCDRHLTVHYSSLNFLPPRHFLTLLDIGEAEVGLRWSRNDESIALLRRACDNDPDGPFAAEALYRLGIATYLRTRSNPEMYAVWDTLRERFPDSVWASRVP
ncbi:MAG TPA: hypothetical protein VMM78_12100 [Thermomicrobiales bacterium]|nr:hypothetical protein [Thermomicrobiales bacterium]